MATISAGKGQSRYDIHISKNISESVSDHVIETENKSSQEVASEIINFVKG